MLYLAIMEVFLNETGDPKYRPHPLSEQKKMVRAVSAGKKEKAAAVLQLRTKWPYGASNIQRLLLLL